MPEQQAQFILDLSTPRVALWLREDAGLRRLAEISIEDNQIVQRLRALRISAEVDGPSLVDIHIPAAEIRSASVDVDARAAAKPKAAAALLFGDLDKPHKRVQQFSSVQPGNMAVALSAVETDVLHQAAQFARGAGFEPHQFSCPDLHGELGVTPVFAMPKQAEPPSYRRVAAAVIVGAILILAGWMYFNLPDRVMLSRVLSAQASAVTEASLLQPVSFSPHADKRAVLALEPAPEGADPLKTVSNDLKAAIKQDVEDLAPKLPAYAETAVYRVAQALNADADLTETRPSLRPFSLSRQDPYQLLETRPQLRQSVAGNESESEGEAPEAETVAALPPEEPAPEEPAPVAVEPEAVEPSEEPAPLAVATVEEPSAVPEAPVAPEPPVTAVEALEDAPATEPTSDIATDDIPQRRPAGFAARVAALDAPIQFERHKGVNPKRRPAALIQQIREAEEEAIAAEARRLAEIEATKEAARLEAEKAKREAEILAKAQEQQVLSQVEANARRPDKYPTRRPARLSRTIARIEGIQKAKADLAAAAPKASTSSASAAIASTGTAAATASKPAKREPKSNRVQNSGVNKNALSLIGVYGKPSARSALLRLRGGKYRKVKAGDTVAGWKVSAIGESSIRIRRGNRNEVLRMP